MVHGGIAVLCLTVYSYEFELWDIILIMFDASQPVGFYFDLFLQTDFVD